MSTEDTLSNALISIRIVHIDHYQQPLHNYSSSISFQAARMTSITPQQTQRLPVIRIFGSTPAGQSCCVHVHGLRPYMYLPVPEGLNPQSTYQYAIKLRAALEQCLKNAFSTADSNADTSSDPPSNFISDVEPVLKYDVYGYHPKQTTFLKISTYAPQTITRIATIVAQKGLPAELATHAPLPYASHIPFVMQFLVDYSLSGMDYLHLSEFKLRRPLPPIERETTNSQSDPTTLYQHRNVERIFVEGLHTTHSHLFWPFHVSKRSACPVELDTFPAHILNANSVQTKDSRYTFTSKTLSVLWEEERLRTGTYPPRAKKIDRPVKAGANLTDEFMTERLKEIYDAELVAQSVEKGANQDQIDEPTRNTQDLSGNIQTPSDSVLDSFDDVFQALDASEGLKALNESDRVDVTPTLHFDEVDEIEDDDHSVESENDDQNDVNTWKDIAECTQNSSEHEALPKHESKDLPQKESSQEQQWHNEDISPDATLTMPVCSNPDFVVIPQPPRPRSNRMYRTEVIATTQSQSQKEQDLFDPGQSSPFINEKLSSGNSNKDTPTKIPSITSSEAKSGKEYTFIRPRIRPPSLATLQKDSEHDAFKIAYDTPFYGQKKDEVTVKESFGGKIIPVRQAGVNGLPEFPESFEIEDTEVEVTPRFVCPVLKPPLISDLYREVEKCSSANQNAVAGGPGMAIDSAGRLVHQKALNTNLDFGGSSNINSHDEVPMSVIAKMLEDRTDTHGSINSSAKNDREFIPESVPSLQETMDYNRPLSPKYDEAYQMPVNAIHNCKSFASWERLLFVLNNSNSYTKEFFTFTVTMIYLSMYCYHTL